MFALSCITLLFSFPFQDVPSGNPWLSFDGNRELDPGLGRCVVLLAGDEEYRSEESLPLLARSLHSLGFECHVLFSQNPETGLIDPNEPAHMPGLELIDGADLVVLQLRFREFKDEDMAHLVRYIDAGKPLIGIRTSTHAFRYRGKSQSQFSHWSWKDKVWLDGFGGQILGETWVSHHGNHGHEATRGLPHPKSKEHPVLRGVTETFGPTDVYAIRSLPADATVLLQGQVVAGMDPSDPAVVGPKNNPMHPVAWLRERPLSDGSTQRIFATTMGAAQDWSSEGLRRLFLQASLWCLRDEGTIPESGLEAPVIGKWDPTPFGFGGARLGFFPEDYRNGSSW